MFGSFWIPWRNWQEPGCALCEGWHDTPVPSLTEFRLKEPGVCWNPLGHQVDYGEVCVCVPMKASFTFQVHCQQYQRLKQEGLNSENRVGGQRIFLSNSVI